MISKPAASPAHPPSTTVDSATDIPVRYPRHCRACDRMINCESGWLGHLAGQKHIRKVKNWKANQDRPRAASVPVATTSTKKKGRNGPVWTSRKCSICPCAREFADKVAYRAHYENVAAAPLLIKCMRCNPGKKMAVSAWDDHECPGKHLIGGRIECKFCAGECTPKHWYLHCRGWSHQVKLGKLAAFNIFFCTCKNCDMLVLPQERDLHVKSIERYKAVTR